MDVNRTGFMQSATALGMLATLKAQAVENAGLAALKTPDQLNVALIGAGAQGRTQLEAVCQVRDIHCAWIFDTNTEAAARYADEMRSRGGRVPTDVRVASSPAEAVREADVICTATTSRAPVFADSDLRPGVHINAIGAFTPQMQEIPAETVRRARVVVGSREACWAEAGDLIIPRDQGLISESHVYAELGEVVAGVKPGRASADEITLFKSVGNAVQDVSVAREVLIQAEQLGLGVEVAL